MVRDPWCIGRWVVALRKAAPVAGIATKRSRAKGLSDCLQGIYSKGAWSGAKDFEPVE